MNSKRELHAAEARMSQVLDLPHPYLLFLGDTTEKGYAKTAFGLRDWARDRCVGEWACAGATVTTVISGPCLECSFENQTGSSRCYNRSTLRLLGPGRVAESSSEKGLRRGM